MDTFLGTILLWPVSWAPQSWLLCQGQSLSVQQYAALYSLIGTIYGGNGTTTFNLPNLQSRFPLGAGSGTGLTPRALGQVAGSETVTLSPANLPPHTHPATFTPAGGTSAGTLGASSAQGNSTNPQGNYLANAFYPGDTGSTAPPVTLASYVTPGSAGTLVNVAGLSISGSGGGTVAVGNNASTNASAATMPPFLALNYIICVQGIYPSRP